MLPKITEFATKVAIHLPEHSHILDIAYLPSGSIKLVEVNPGLTPKDLGSVCVSGSWQINYLLTGNQSKKTVNSDRNLYF